MSSTLAVSSDQCSCSGEGMTARAHVTWTAWRPRRPHAVRQSSLPKQAVPWPCYGPGAQASPHTSCGRRPPSSLPTQVVEARPRLSPPRPSPPTLRSAAPHARRRIPQRGRPGSPTSRRIPSRIPSRRPSTTSVPPRTPTTWPVAPHTSTRTRRRHRRRRSELQSERRGRCAGGCARRCAPERSGA